MNEACNVFVVFTPLHVLIADAIIRSEAMQEVHVLALTDGSAKTQRCCERYLGHSASIAYVPLHRDFRVISTFRLIAEFVARLGSRPVAIHTGSLKSLYSRIILGMLKQDFSLNTFDDGYGSLRLDGYFAQPDAPLKRWMIALFDRRLTYQNLVSSIAKHFTIYAGANVYSAHCRELVRISIQPRSENARVQLPAPRIGGPLRILLTQPISERLGVAVEDEAAAYNAAIHRFGIEYRLPHPAEDHSKAGLLRAPTIQTDLVAEELACVFATDGPVEFYAFGSTVLLNVADVENVTGYWLMDETLNAHAPLCGAANLHVIKLP